MARPTITYNASSGSDTAASGAGPATAVTGSSAAYSGDGAGGGTQTVITFTNSPDLSGVATDGSDALWLNTSSGERHLFRITAVDDGADTVTVHTAPDTAINSGSAVSYAIGGKRQTLENDTSNEDWLDCEAGWTYELEAGTYTVSSTIQIPISVGDHTDGPVLLTSSDPGSVEPVIDRTGSFDTVTTSSARSIIIDGIKFTRSSGTSNNCAINAATGDYVSLRRVVVDGTGMDSGIEMNDEHFSAIDCEVYNVDQGSAYGFDVDKGVMIRCSSHDNTGEGFHFGATSGGLITWLDCLSYDNGDSGYHISSFGAGSSVTMKGCLSHGNTGDGFEISDTTSDDRVSLIYEDNTLVSNGGYGANVEADHLNQIASNQNNHYHGNTSGARNNLPAGTDDTSGDPLFTSVTDGSENFTPTTGSPLLDAAATAPTA